MAETGITFEAKISEVHAKRSNAAIFGRQLANARQQFEAEHAVLIADVKEMQAAVVQAEDELRTMALNWFKLTNGVSKQPAPGVGIRIVGKPVYEPAHARQWCEQHHLFMTVEWKAFEKFAKDNPTGLDFVTIVYEAQATIATDLESVLG